MPEPLPDIPPFSLDFFPEFGPREPFEVQLSVLRAPGFPPRRIARRFYGEFHLMPDPSLRVEQGERVYQEALGKARTTEDFLDRVVRELVTDLMRPNPVISHPEPPHEED